MDIGSFRLLPSNKPSSCLLISVIIDGGAHKGLEATLGPASPSVPFPIYGMEFIIIIHLTTTINMHSASVSHKSRKKKEMEKCDGFRQEEQRGGG